MQPEQPAGEADRPVDAGRQLPPHEGLDRKRQFEALGMTAQQNIRAWIEENQMLALLGGFALGVFAGVLMRR